MDVAALRECIHSTLSANPDVRKHGELQLKHAEATPGFISALLDIVETEPDENVRLSAVIFLKNRVMRAWGSNIDTRITLVPENEKGPFRERLIPILAHQPSKIRQQLIPLIGKILHYDFPEQWPSYMDITVRLLGEQNIQSVFAGIQCLLAICRVYRFKKAEEKREELEKVIQATFAQILDIGNKLATQTDTEAGEMLRLIFKTYKHAIFFELLPALRQHDSIVGWATLFITVVRKEPPPDSLVEDVDEREMHSWWKAKKWAYSNLNRLFVRYGNPNSLTKSTKDYEGFAQQFITNFVPKIAEEYLIQVDLWAQKKVWLSRNCLSFTLSFLEECVKPKSTWQFLKPHVDNLVAHVLFPLLCQSDEDLELFETDPAEYIHRKINFYEDISAPDVAATNFLTTVTKSRKTTVYTVLNFVNEVVQKYEQAPDNEKNPKEKEGALRMIGTLATIILGKKSPIADRVEYFFVRHVFPEFSSPHGYLRARACDVVDKFSDLEFTEENNVVVIYQNIIQCLNDPEQPVRVEAALALSPLIRHKYVKNAMQQTIVPIMQQLMKLTNEVDLDALANVMEEFVECFAPQLTPFAVELTEQLRDTYLRIVGEIVEKSTGANADDDAYGEFIDDKSITALGVLQTIGTLILTLETAPDVMLRLETILVPVVEATLQNKLYELYNEIFEIIDSCTFSAKHISPTMWTVFELIHKTFKDRSEVFVEEMLPALDNYVSYGADVMRVNPEYLEAIFDIIQTIFLHDKLNAVDRICGCKLAEAVLLNLRGHADQYLQRLIELPMMALTVEHGAEPKSYRIHLIEMIINCVYYNPATTLQILETHGWTNKFFSLWFSNMDYFTRVHDKKLSIVAIVALLSVPPEHVPASIQPGWPKLLQGLVKLFQTLPNAMKAREESAKEEPYEDTYESDSENEWEGGWAKDGEAEGDEDVADENQAYMEFLSAEAQKFSAQNYSDDEEDELEEEGLFETPLDSVEPYILFRDSFYALQQVQPGLHDSMTKALSAEERAVLEGVVRQADANVQAQTQALQPSS